MELNTTLERPRDADRRKDEFLAMLAHELRNPLAPIRNALGILRFHLGEQPPDVCRAYEVIERQVTHLARLVDDLLDVSRITRGRIKLQKETLSVQRAVERALESSRPLLDARRHATTVKFPGEPLYVEGDATRINQVLLNLLDNSAKYTPEGGHIALTVEAERGYAVIRVRDDGVGIAPEVLPRVFDLFAQADRTLARTEGGLGIGLTLVRRITEMHGGTVEARSEGMGKGSEFIIRLPLAPGPSDTPHLRDRAPTEPRQEQPPLRVLVVDDNADSAESLAVLLRLLGHEVQTAGDGPGALAVLRGFPADLLLCDIGLPGMSGYEVAQQVRADPSPYKPILVAVTGYGSDEDRRRALEAGFQEHVVKPPEFGTILKILSSVATGRH